MQVVMGHVIDDVAQEAASKQSAPHRLRQDEPEQRVEEGDHRRSRHRGEDQAGAIEGGLWMEAWVSEVALGPRASLWSCDAEPETLPMEGGAEQPDIPVRGQPSVMGRLGTFGSFAENRPPCLKDLERVCCSPISNREEIRQTSRERGAGCATGRMGVGVPAAQSYRILQKLTGF